MKKFLRKMKKREDENKNKNILTTTQEKKI